MKKSFLHLAAFFAFFVVIAAACRKTDRGRPERPAEGNEILVAPYPDSDNGELLILDSSGNIIKDQKLNRAALNFKRWDINGDIRYSYFQYDPSYTIPVLGTALGDIVITDGSLNEIKRVRLQPFNGRTPDDPTAIDGHDFILIDDDHYMVMTYYLQTVNNIPPELAPLDNTRVLADIIQEVKNGEVVWEWNSTDHPEFYGTTVESNYSDTSIQNYMHLNSIFIDPRDNNIICSMRNQDQVVKIDRKTGDVIWRLGGKKSDFPMTPDMYFLRQHHATLVDNNQTLLLYDNGEINQRPYSRVLEFKLDEAGKTITGFKAFTLPDSTFSQFMGSVQKRGDTYFVGCGSEPKFMEVNYNTGEIVFQKELTSPSYRAFKY